MRDRLILQKIVLYCQRIADNLERYHHDFSAFEQDYLFQDTLLHDIPALKTACEAILTHV